MSGAARRGRRRSTSSRSATRATGCAAASSTATAGRSRSPTPRWRRSSVPTAGRSPRRGWYDTEALADDGGTLYVGIERVNEIVRFDYRQGRPARARPADRGAAGDQVAAGQQGHRSLVACREGRAARRHADRDLRARPRRRRQHPGLPDRPAPAARSRSSAPTSSTSATARCTPRGDLLVLERRFSWTARPRDAHPPRAARRRSGRARWSTAPELIVADLGYQIDNMEGLSVHRAADGELVLTLISDDNFSALQRTLLLQFTLASSQAGGHPSRRALARAPSG